MSSDGYSDEAIVKNPNLELAQLKFLLSQQGGKNPDLQGKLMAAVKADNMSHFYLELCADLKWPVDQVMVDAMNVANQKKLQELDDKIEDAEKNHGEMEIRESNLKRAEFLSSIGDKKAALEALDKTLTKTVSLGQKLDIMFQKIRIGFFYLDYNMVRTVMEKTKAMMEEGGDWDRRNRLRVYEGLYCLSVRDFKKAADLFLETVSTFTCTELCDYKDFVVNTVLTSIISLDRMTLQKKVVKGSEILEVLHGMPDIHEYLFSLYNCQYGVFFTKLSHLEQWMKTDRYFAPHVRFYVKEMKILAYAQLLESYQTLSLQYMADTFGVSVTFMDQELARFIAAGRLHCKIDKVNGLVETNRPDKKNHQYQMVIKQGDVLLNRIQKLSRVINI